MTTNGDRFFFSLLSQLNLWIIDMLIQSRDGRFGSKVGQIGPKLDKSGTFSDQISVHLARQIGP